MYPFSPPESFEHQENLATLAEHLGYSRNDRLLIINADDFGLTQDINDAVIELAEKSRITSTTIMVPAPAYQNAAEQISRRRSLDCGVHLTLTSENAALPSRPVSDSKRVASLLEGSAFHVGVDGFFRKADAAEAELEASAQIEKAIADGIDITHIDSHEGSLQLDPRFAPIFLRLAAKYRLPIRMASRALLQELELSVSWRDEVRKLKIPVTDNLIYLPMSRFPDLTAKKNFLLALLGNLPAGVTEVYFHPSLRSIHSVMSHPAEETAVNPASGDDYWRRRCEDYEILVSGEFHQRINELGIGLISYRPLREMNLNVQ